MRLQHFAIKSQANVLRGFIKSFSYIIRLLMMINLLYNSLYYLVINYLIFFSMLTRVMNITLVIHKNLHLLST